MIGSLHKEDEVLCGSVRFQQTLFMLSRDRKHLNEPLCESGKLLAMYLTSLIRLTACHMFGIYKLCFAGVTFNWTHDTLQMQKSNIILRH